ncbi:helix-turn-helix domain-containing protein [Streptomyces sp. NPDC057702]|uniref:helix-turn-helix domain-containing protein n=1 Tax=Streptomyces sp. NPDC057702 TaxID=3346221 RepID=UPI00369D119C
MSYQAQTWVDAVGIKHCKNGGELLVLIRVANHTNGEMRGCYASAETLAGECLMGESTVLKHLRRLKAGGVLVPGDPELVSHLRADRRPPVYDLAGGHEAGCPGKHNVGDICRVEAVEATGVQIEHPRKPARATGARSEHSQKKRRSAGGRSEHPSKETPATGVQIDLSRVFKSSTNSCKELNSLFIPAGAFTARPPRPSPEREREASSPKADPSGPPCASAQEVPSAACAVEAAMPGQRQQGEGGEDLELRVGKVVEAYVLALGGVYPTQATTQRLRTQARELLARGWPLDHVVKLAAQMPGRGYVDLTRHADHNPPPAPKTAGSGAAVAWCGQCDSPEYRWIAPREGSPRRCPQCNPALVTTTTLTATV